MSCPASAAHFTDMMVVTSPTNRWRWPGWICSSSFSRGKRRLCCASSRVQRIFCLKKRGEVNSEPPTVDGEHDLGLSHADPGYDGLAHVLASVRLAHWLQVQLVVVAKDLQAPTDSHTRTVNMQKNMLGGRYARCRRRDFLRRAHLYLIH